MSSLRRIRNIVRWCIGGPRMPEPGRVQELCIGLLGDVAAHDRELLLQRLGRLRRADDLWELRNVLFGLVSAHHGESVARERLSRFDADIAASPRRRPPRRNAWSATVT